MSPSGLVGNYHVFPTAAAITRAWKLCGGKMREYQLLRRHALKLAYWPTGRDDGDSATDINWDWIKSLEKKRIGELRIDELINGQDNVRVIFFKANLVLEGSEIARIWLLTAFQKKAQKFSNAEIRAFSGMREIIVQRHYGGSSQA
jgi:hypothetical protein